MGKQEQILIYEGKNGVRVELRLDGKFDTFWATATQIGEIFGIDRTGVVRHKNNILESGELEASTCARFAHVEGKEEPEWYNLDMIIAIGYRAKSLVATQFRIWATKILREYITKGFAMDDERLKDPTRNQYFEELLERIREIRASEKLFYQKVREVYATAIDYDKNSQEAREFFASVQNELLYAVCKKRAAEIIIERANKDDLNFGLTSWRGSKVRKIDVLTAKNYLYKNEIDELNTITTMLLDYAELQTRKRIQLTMKDWKTKLDSFIVFNEYEVCPDAGKISHEEMERIIGNKYQEFDNIRIAKEKEEAEREAAEDARRLEKEVEELLRKKQDGTISTEEKKSFKKAIRKIAKTKLKK